MDTLSKHFSLWIALLCLALVSCSGSKSSALDAARLWARLAPFPVAESEIEVETRGSMFTREFRISFSSSEIERTRWLRDCPGIADATVSMDGDWRIYSIKPGEGANFAEVRVNEATGLVEVRTYWS